MEKHNHGPNWGIPVEGCPRCEELKTKPYIVKFKIEGDKRISKIPVAGVREATEIIQTRLPAVVIGVPVVETPGGECVAILKVEGAPKRDFVEVPPDPYLLMLALAHTR